MEIFQCAPEQADMAAEFYDRVTEYLEKHINYPKWVRGDYPSFKSASRAAAAGEQYLCTDGGKVVGAFVLDDKPHGNYDAGDWQTELSQGEYLVIHALASDPMIYRRGIGKRMVEYCILKSRERGYRAIRLDVVPTNTPARQLYESMGFTCAGEKDLDAGIEGIPVFALYELNFGEK